MVLLLIIQCNIIMYCVLHNIQYWNCINYIIYHIYPYSTVQYISHAVWKNCAEQKICLFLCFKPVCKTLVKSEGSPRRAMDRGGFGCQNTSFHEYFSDSKCLLKGQSTQSWSHGASVWGLIHQPTPFRLLILLVL